MIQVIPVRAFKDNYIWLIVDETQSVWVVDPGDATPLNHYLHQHHLTLSGILITHHHLDHSGAVADLLNEWGSVPVYAHVNSKVPRVSDFVKTGDKVHVGKIVLNVLEIPGHTLDHLAFYNAEMLFCGDTLFSAGCGRVFEGTYEQMYDSLSHILQMPDEVKIYCGHEYTLQNLRFAEKVEPNNLFIQKKIAWVNELLANGKPSLPSTLLDEKNMNPFLRCHEKTVIQAAEGYAKKALNQSFDVFKQLREWKNQS